MKETKSKVAWANSTELPTFIANGLGSTSKRSFGIEFGYNRSIYLNYSGDVEKGKRIVERISEYYKNT